VSFKRAQSSAVPMSALISSIEANAVGDGEKRCILDDMKTTRDGLPVASAVALKED
jgi:hypothetical protein